MYDPILGRWLEQDPIGFDAGDMNLYRMEGNNPVNEIDPSGLAATPSIKDIAQAFLNRANLWNKTFPPGEAALGVQLPMTPDYRVLERAIEGWDREFATLVSQAGSLIPILGFLIGNNKTIATIRKTIEQLGSDDFCVREQAQKDLIKMGSIAYPFVLAATNHSDLEIRRRAGFILESISPSQLYLQAQNLYRAMRLQQVLSQMPEADRRKVLGVITNIPEPYPPAFGNLGRILKEAAKRPNP